MSDLPPRPFTENRVHILQTIVLLVPLVLLFGSVITLYLSMRTDIAQAQWDIKTLQAAGVEARTEERASAKETKESFTNIQLLITQLRIDIASYLAARGAKR
jgi:hypothetical protein